MKAKNKKGFLLMIATILLIIPLIFLISYYTGSSGTVREDAIGQMRCDELHYFVEDIKRDMERSVTVFGRRAVVYALDGIIESGESLENYSFTCSASCGVDCAEFTFGDTGAEAAIAELSLCGTMYGAPVEYMENHTIPYWLDDMVELAAKRHFILDMEVDEVKVVPRDAWNIALIVDYKMSAEDEKGLCYYTETVVRAISQTDIIGLEDPTYILQTDGHMVKYIDNCTAAYRSDVVAGCSKSTSLDPADGGLGVGGGDVVFYSSFGNVPALISYCNNADPYELSKQILLFDQAVGLACMDSVWEACFNASSERHFGGVVDYGSATCGSCPGTVPYVCETGEMDNEVPLGGGNRLPGCDMEFVTSGDCVLLMNLITAGCEAHQVLVGYDSNSTNTTCYYVSDIEEYYDSDCATNYSNGPSFFDRMDGRLNLTDKYVSQSLEYFNTSLIGIETLVFLYDLKEYNSMYPSIPYLPNSTWVDYLYWQGVEGCPVSTSCEALGERFKLDCPHSFKYDVDTDCSNVSRCTCSDGVCEAGESCALDAFVCPDNICYEPTCDAGCAEDPYVNEADPGECDGTGIGCAASGCYCNAISECVDCLPLGLPCGFDDQCCSGNCHAIHGCKA